MISLCQHFYFAPNQWVWGKGCRNSPADEEKWVPCGSSLVAGVWVPPLSVGATEAGQPLHGLGVHLQLGKLELKCLKVFVPTIVRGQTVGDLALAHR